MHRQEPGKAQKSNGNTASSARYRSGKDAVTLAEVGQKLGEGSYSTNSTGEVRDANPALMEMVGISSLEELRKIRVQDLIDASVREREIALVDQNGSISNVELKLTRSDGQVRTVLDTGSVCRDPPTDEKLYHGILGDLTARTARETRLPRTTIRPPPTACPHGQPGGAPLGFPCLTTRTAAPPRAPVPVGHCTPRPCQRLRPRQHPGPG